MKTLALICTSLVLVLSVSACNTWSGVKQDAKEVGKTAGEGIEKAGEKLKDVSK